MRIVVVLPAPFGPTKPTTWPEENANDTSLTARVDPKFFFRLTIWTFIVRSPRLYRKPGLVPCGSPRFSIPLRRTGWRRRRPDNNPAPGTAADIFRPPLFSLANRRRYTIHASRYYFRRVRYSSGLTLSRRPPESLSPNKSCRRDRLTRVRGYRRPIR